MGSLDKPSEGVGVAMFIMQKGESGSGLRCTRPDGNRRRVDAEQGCRCRMKGKRSKRVDIKA